MTAVALWAAASIPTTRQGAVDAKAAVAKPDLQAIRQAVNDPASRMYYPRLMHEFLANDTLMNAQQFQHLYYGYLYQEDYEPYRHSGDSAALRQMHPLYVKDKHSQAECRRIMEYARRSLADNPLDIKQINYLIYAFEHLGKVNLAKIWQNKLNHLLQTIATSGSGLTPEEARIVVLPQHEYEFLNLSGRTVTGSEFVAPRYDYIRIQPLIAKDPEGYYFDIQPMLEQYYLKHPSER